MAYVAGGLISIKRKYGAVAASNSGIKQNMAADGIGSVSA